MKISIRCFEFIKNILPLEKIHLKTLSLLSIILLSIVSCGEQELSLRELRQQAQKAIDEKDYDTAIIHYRKLVFRSDTPENRVKLGKLYFQLFNIPAAHKEFSKARETKAPASSWLIPYGVSAILSEKYNAIEKLSDNDFQYSDQKAEILALHAWVALKNNQLQKARALVNDAIRLQADSQILNIVQAIFNLKNKQYKTALQHLSAISSSYLDNDKHLLLASASTHLKDYSDAIAYLETAYKRHPNDPRIIFKLANISLIKKDDLLIKKYFAIIDQRYSQTIFDNLLKGKWHFINKRFDKSKDFFQKAISIEKNDPEANMFLGIISAQNAQWEQSINYFNTNLKAQPFNLSSLLSLGQVYLLGLKDPSLSIELLSPHSERFKNEPAFRMLYIDVLMANKNYNQALFNINTFQKDFPNLNKIIISKALAYYQLDNTEQAILELNAISEKPSLASQLVLLNIYLNDKKIVEADKLTVSLAQNYPDNLFIQELNGQKFYRSNDKDSAKTIWQNITQKEPSYKNAWYHLAKLAMENKDIQELTAITQKMEEVFDNNSDTLTMKWELAKLQNNSAQAISIAESIWKIEKNNLQIGNFLVNYFLETEPYKAEQIAAEMIKAQPESAVSHFNVGKTLVRLRKWEDSILAFKKAIHFDDTAVHYYLALLTSYQVLQQDKLIHTLFENSKHKFSENLVFKRHYIQYLVKNNKIKQAQAVLAKTSNKIHKYYLQIEYFSSQKKYDDAIKTLDALRKIEDSPELIIWLSNLYSASKMPQKALALLKESYEKEKNNLLLMNLAEITLKQKLYKEAAEHYEILLNAYPGNLQILNNLTWIYCELSDKRALDVARKITTFNSKFPEVIDSIAWAEIKFGDKEVGIDHLEKLTIKYPERFESQYHLALGYISTRKEDKAISLLEKLQASQHPVAEKAKIQLEQLKNIPKNK